MNSLQKYLGTQVWVRAIENGGKLKQMVGVFWSYSSSKLRLILITLTYLSFLQGTSWSVPEIYH